MSKQQLADAFLSSNLLSLCKKKVYALLKDHCEKYTYKQNLSKLRDAEN